MAKMNIVKNRFATFENMQNVQNLNPMIDYCIQFNNLSSKSLIRDIFNGFNQKIVKPLYGKKVIDDSAIVDFTFMEGTGRCFYYYLSSRMGTNDKKCIHDNLYYNKEVKRFSYNDKNVLIRTINPIYYGNCIDSKEKKAIIFPDDDCKNINFSYNKLGIFSIPLCLIFGWELYGEEKSASYYMSNKTCRLNIVDIENFLNRKSPINYIDYKDAINYKDSKFLWFPFYKTIIDENKTVRGKRLRIYKYQPMPKLAVFNKNDVDIIVDRLYDALFDLKLNNGENY